MSCALRHMVDIALRDASPVLVGDAARRIVARQAASLPQELTRGIYLECRLADTAPRVDLSICLERPGRSLLAADAPAHPLAAALWAADAWHPIRALCRDWADETSPLHRHVSRLWLEFDAEPEEVAPAVPAPAVFVDFGPAVGRLPLGERCGVLDRVLEALGAPPEPPQRLELHTGLGALAALGSGASVFQLGLFPRRGRAVRLCVAGVRARDVGPLLGTLGWDAERQAVASLATFLQRATHDEGGGPTLLHLDFDGRLRQRVGLEFSLQACRQQCRALRALPLLGALHDAGWCAADKWEALSDWPGAAVHRLEHEWLPHLATRRVNHLKLVWEHGRVMEAKAYLFERFVPQSAVQRGSTPWMSRC